MKMSREVGDGLGIDFDSRGITIANQTVLYISLIGVSMGDNRC